VQDSAHKVVVIALPLCSPACVACRGVCRVAR
jgi:hypothetical protein